MAETGRSRRSRLARRRVLDADGDEPVPGAIVTVKSVCCSSAVTPLPSATADESGAFVLEAKVPSHWEGLSLGVARDGYESNGSYWSLRGETGVTLRLYRSVSIRPGDTLELRMFLGDLFDGITFARCSCEGSQFTPGSTTFTATGPMGPIDVRFFGRQAREVAIRWKYPNLRPSYSLWIMVCDGA